MKNFKIKGEWQSKREATDSNDYDDFMKKEAKNEAHQIIQSYLNVTKDAQKIEQKIHKKKGMKSKPESKFDQNVK